MKKFYSIIFLLSLLTVQLALADTATDGTNAFYYSHDECVENCVTAQGHNTANCIDVPFDDTDYDVIYEKIKPILDKLHEGSDCSYDDILEDYTYASLYTDCFETLGTNDEAIGRVNLEWFLFPNSGFNIHTDYIIDGPSGFVDGDIANIMVNKILEKVHYESRPINNPSFRDPRGIIVEFTKWQHGYNRPFEIEYEFANEARETVYDFFSCTENDGEACGKACFEECYKNTVVDPSNLTFCANYEYNNIVDFFPDKTTVKDEEFGTAYDNYYLLRYEGYTSSIQGSGYSLHNLQSVSQYTNGKVPFNVSILLSKTENDSCHITKDEIICCQEDETWTGIECQAQTNVAVCYDSDGGKNYFMQGNTTITKKVENDLAPVLLASNTDFCEGSILTEYICKNKINIVEEDEKEISKISGTIKNTLSAISNAILGKSKIESGKVIEEANIIDELSFYISSSTYDCKNSGCLTDANTGIGECYCSTDEFESNNPRGKGNFFTSLKTDGNGDDPKHNNYPNFQSNESEIKCCENENMCIYDNFGTGHYSCVGNSIVMTELDDITDTPSIVCNEGSWYDCDFSKDSCSSCGQAWIKGGIAPNYQEQGGKIVFLGEYDAFNQYECCGDDLNEVIIGDSPDEICESTIATYDYDICCPDETYKNHNGKCVQTCPDIMRTQRVVVDATKNKTTLAKWNESLSAFNEECNNASCMLGCDDLYCVVDIRAVPVKEPVPFKFCGDKDPVCVFSSYRKSILGNAFEVEEDCTKANLCERRTVCGETVNRLNKTLAFDGKYMCDVGVNLEVVEQIEEEEVLDIRGNQKFVEKSRSYTPPNKCTPSDSCQKVVEKHSTGHNCNYVCDKKKPVTYSEIDETNDEIISIKGTVVLKSGYENCEIVCEYYDVPKEVISYAGGDCSFTGPTCDDLDNWNLTRFGNYVIKNESQLKDSDCTLIGKSHGTGGIQLEEEDEFSPKGNPVVPLYTANNKDIVSHSDIKCVEEYFCNDLGCVEDSICVEDINMFENKIIMKIDDIEDNMERKVECANDGNGNATTSLGDYWCPERFIYEKNDLLGLEGGCRPAETICDSGFQSKTENSCNNLLDSGETSDYWNMYRNDCFREGNQANIYDRGCCLSMVMNNFEVYEFESVKVY